MRGEDSSELRAHGLSSNKRQENAMLEYSWRLISPNGETRHQEKVTLSTLSAVWSILAEIADRFGRPGEVLQVIDQEGQMVIRMGVATARSTAMRSYHMARAA
jgi:hypothetical protein